MPRSQSPLAERPTRPADEEEHASPLARGLAAAAAAAAVILVGILLFSGGGAYRVSAVFPNAGQLVVGNNVDIGVFGTYLCQFGNGVPTVSPLPTVPPGLQNLVKQFAFAPGNPAPPCTPQPPLGRLLHQNRLYPHVIRQAHPRTK